MVKRGFLGEVGWGYKEFDGEGGKGILVGGIGEWFRIGIGVIKERLGG
jgi:hypothetical protein